MSIFHKTFDETVKVKTFLVSQKVLWLQIPRHFMFIFHNTFGENVEVNTQINKKLDIITTILIL